MSSLQDEHRRQPFPDRDTAEPAKSVKPTGIGSEGRAVHNARRANIRRRAMGKDLGKTELAHSDEASREQRRGARHRWDDGERTSSIPEGTLVGDQGSSRKRGLTAEPSQTGGDRQTRWRGQAVRDTECTRSLPPTSDIAGVGCVIRTVLFGTQLRVSARPQCAGSREAGPDVRASRLRRVRGYRSGEIF